MSNYYHCKKISTSSFKSTCKFIKIIEGGGITFGYYRYFHDSFDNSKLVELDEARVKDITENPKYHTDEKGFKLIALAFKKTFEKVDGDYYRFMEIIDKVIKNLGYEFSVEDGIMVGKDIVIFTNDSHDGALNKSLIVKG